MFGKAFAREANAFTISVPRVEARVPTRRRGPKNYAAEDSESIREQAGRHYNSLLSIASLL